MSSEPPTRDRKPFPQGGNDWAQIDAQMDELVRDDADWRGGRSPLYVFLATEEAARIGKRGFEKFFSENALGGKRVFHGLRQMESDLINFGLDLFNAPEAAGGTVSTGGSESILIAVRAAREQAREQRSVKRGDDAFNIVIPVTAHPAFDKACDLMDIEIRRTPLDEERRVDVDAMEALINKQTIMLLGSAPCFPHGVIDPIDKLSALALERNLWLHVDACVGGYIVPFLQRSGRTLREFDFGLAGVRSLSADLHKYGFCPKPISTVFFRDQEDLNRAKFAYDFWPSGAYETSTITGTRAGGAIAGAWAVLNHLGIDGFTAVAVQLGTMIDRYVEGIESIEGLHMLARPDATIINYTADELDIYAVAERMGKRGWVPGLLKRPKGMHLMMSMYHDPVREEYLADLAASVEDVRDGAASSSTLQAEY